MNDTYMDARACAFRDTMICYRDDADQVRLPARAGDLRLKRLGNGALCCPRLERLEVEEGYEVIPAETIIRLSNRSGRRASLCLPATLTTVSDLVPDRPIYPVGKAQLTRIELARQLPLGEYRTLVETSVAVNGGLRLPVGVTDTHGPCRTMLQVLRAGGIGVVDTLNAEFPLFSFDDHGVRPMLFKPKKSLSRAGERPVDNENEALLRRIAQGHMGARDPMAERLNDRMQQMGEDILDKKKTVALICFDERSAVNVGGAVRFVLQAQVGELFCISLRRVCLKGRDYYVYARLHLQPAGTQPAYLREDVCVYGEDRLVTDPVLSEEVYEKYRLLNTL